MMRAALLVLALMAAAARAQPAAQALDAHADEARAAHRLALEHRNGLGVARDAVRARHLAQMAAQGGLPAAMFLLSAMLAGGEGGAKDEAGARRWLEAAAALGYPAALQELALTEPDPRQAALLMRQAAHALQHQGGDF